MTAISSNHYSVDQQVQDALDYLQTTAPNAYDDVVSDFPEVGKISYSGSWFDTEAMGVDVEWSMWLIERIEATDLVIWEEGEPWAMDALDIYHQKMEDSEQ